MLCEGAHSFSINRTLVPLALETIFSFKVAFWELESSTYLSFLWGFS